MTRVKIALLVATLLGATFTPPSAHARELAIWDQIQGTNPKGYVLLMRHALAPGVGDPENFQAVAGVSLESGEGALVRATPQGEIKILGYSPKP